MKNKFEDFSAEVDSLPRFERNLKLKRITKIVIPIVIVLILLGLAFWKFYFSGSAQNQTPVQTVGVEIPKGEDHVFVNDVQGVVPDAPAQNKNETAVGASGSLYTSEHYQIKDMAFGANAIVLSGSSESLPLKVVDVRSEVLASKDGEDVKLLITWKTNKLSQSEITYEKGAIKRKLSEGGFGISHALVLSDLERDSRYTFFVKVKDRWGNEVLSENHSLYTGKKPVSVFGLISDQMDQIFGWAIRK